MARIVIPGGAGFIGSHLCERNLADGHEVVAIDNLLTGDIDNIAHLMGDPGFTFQQQDCTHYIHVSGPVDAIMHFASPASPVDYLELPIQTLKGGSLGTHNVRGLAKAGRHVLWANSRYRGADHALIMAKVAADLGEAIVDAGSGSLPRGSRLRPLHRGGDQARGAHARGAWDGRR